MKKLFFALWPDDEARQKLVQLQQAIDAKGVRWVPGQNLHATLVFLGNVDETTETAIQQRVAGISIGPFTLTFDQLSYWRRPRILCLTCRQFGPEVVALADHSGTTRHSTDLSLDWSENQKDILLDQDQGRQVDMDQAPSRELTD